MFLKISEKYLERRRDKAKLRVAFVNEHVSDAIILNGYYEKPQLEVLLQFLNHIGCRFRVFVDVGANIGNHTIFFSNQFDKIIAVEPSMINFELLKLNTFQHAHINLKKFALSKYEGTAEFHVPVKNRGSGSLSSEWGNRVKDII